MKLLGERTKRLGLLSVATNVKFEIDDIDEEWTYNIPFDYIHSRFMSSSIADWKVYLTKCLK